MEVTVLIVGIDPGLKGGVCCLRDTGAIAWLVPMPGTQEFIQLMGKLPHGTEVYLEHAQAMPKNGVVSMFNYGTHFGSLQGVLSVLHYPVTLVRPRAWQADMTADIDRQITEPKLRAATAAMKLHGPKGFAEAFVLPRCRRVHDGMVDAYLIAMWGRSQHVRKAG